MIHFSESLIVILIQAIIVLSLASLGLLVALIKKHDKLKAYVRSQEAEQHSSNSVSVEHYLATEVKLTEGRSELLYKDTDLLSTEFGEADWLVLRVKFLEIEKGFSSTTDREDNFWKLLGVSLKNMLSEMKLVKRVQANDAKEEDDDEVKELKNMLKEQAADIEKLNDELSGADTEEKVEIMKDKLLKLSNSHRELSHCVMVLEDENLFLREQIRSLLADDAAVETS